ncbi:hypothetical protein VTO73DRAFT_10069 [Trametes versicolor]
MAHNDKLTSLTNYLSQAYLPPLIIDEELPQNAGSANPWPRIHELDIIENNVRLCQVVTKIPLEVLQHAVRSYYAGFDNRLRVDWANTRLTLPCPGVTVMSRRDMSHLFIQNSHDFLEALDRFILGTTAEALRTIEGCPFDEDTLKFVRIPVHGAVHGAVDKKRLLWWVHTFGPQDRPTSILRPGIAVLSFTPWELGVNDLKEFSARAQFAPNEFQRDNVVGKPWSNALKAWAMAYDSCRVSGYRWFVITTYDQWVFGTWSLDWTGAEVTDPVPFDKTHGMSVIEMLTFWMECGRQKTMLWQISADMPRRY